MKQKIIKNKKKPVIGHRTINRRLKKHSFNKKKSETSKGYIKIYMPKHPFKKNNCILEHRLVVERKIGRYLDPKEVVHHINENKEDNRIENLMLFKNNTLHIKFHTKIKQFGMTNPIKRQIRDRWKDINNLGLLQH